jgi:hypothetical protein
MEDCTGRELNVGDVVAFSVGTSLLTGTIIKFRDKVYSPAYTIPVAKVSLTTPEAREDKIVYRKNPETGQYLTDPVSGAVLYDIVPQDPRMTRDVFGSERIVLLKPLDNSGE